jgi:VIT1/CCC1 family predicted Fe2+/Mn2+ transporter
MSDTIVSAAYAPVALVMLLALLQFFGFIIGTVSRRPPPRATKISSASIAYR